MHHLKSTSAILRFRFAAVLLCAKCVLLPLAVATVLVALIIGNHPLALTGLALVGLSLLIAILQWLLAQHSACPLCLAPVLARSQCTPHRHAKTFLGSHRLRAAVAILFKNSFACPYCHEPTAMKLRDPSPRPRVVAPRD